jgi:hypothetical protein
MTEEAGEPVELLGRFADPELTKEVDLGPCDCPGQSHGNDSAQVRAQIGDGEFNATLYDQPTPADADDAIAARFTLSWTLLDQDGEPVQITPTAIRLLDRTTRTALLMALKPSVNWREQLPNASGARSRGSSPASASPNRAARRRK